MAQTLPTCRRRATGFTLIELMIAVAIVALLAAVALPSFFDSLRKSRRTEAYTAIAAVQQAQERWRSGRAEYAGNLTSPPTDLSTPGLGLPATTPKGYYTIALGGNTATGYTVSAVAVSSSSQGSDTACLKMAARVAGGQVTYAGCQSCTLADSDFSESNVCWSR
jgi:type IV pilus assembly protein PilE